MDESKVSISFDDEFRLRVLDADKYKQTESLDAECTVFVNKIQEFNTTVSVCQTTQATFVCSSLTRFVSKVHSLVEVLDKQSTKIETEKLKVRLAIIFYSDCPLHF